MVEISVKCPRCEAPIHLDGPRRTILCERCLSETDFPVDVWRDTLEEPVTESKGMKHGTGTQSTVFGHFNMSLLYGNQTPYCPNCKRDFNPETDRQGETLSCPDCGTKVSWQEPPPWFLQAVPKAVCVVGAEPESPSEDAGNGRNSDAPVAFTCPQCSGTLVVDGKDRLVPCGYCNTRVYLPDGLWLRLHPVRKKQRWYIGV